MNKLSEKDIENLISKHEIEAIIKPSQELWSRVRELLNYRLDPNSAWLRKEADCEAVIHAFKDAMHEYVMHGLGSFYDPKQNLIH